jgi:hypothetical protein
MIAIGVVTGVLLLVYGLNNWGYVGITCYFVGGLLALVCAVEFARQLTL